MTLRLLFPGRLALAAIACVALLAAPAMAADEASPDEAPVKVVADQRLAVTTPAGTGALALYVSRDWSKPQPDVTRAVIVIHGRLRNADVYNASAEKALAAAGEDGKTAILVVPQFLATVDAKAHDLPAETLRWGVTGWEGGSDAKGPAAISSFDALDAILARLADRSVFPNLKTVVVAGHSGGGQVVQRYAILAKGEAALAAAGIAVRYVVANPSSYAYFSADRPDGKGGFGPFAGAAACPKYDHWKYGMHDLPRYAGSATTQALEQAYIGRDVAYLLGTADTDPNHPALDKTCMAKAEGPYRLARGQDYLQYLRGRHPDGFRQTLRLVQGVGHDGDRMLTSDCGLAALFDRPGCAPTTP
jgi:pimeloyl-ACP methyl ester carboxylesterase